MRELATHEKRLRVRTDRLGLQDERTRTGHRHATRLLHDSAQTERPLGERLANRRIGWLLVDLAVRQLEMRVRPAPGAHRQSIQRIHSSSNSTNLIFAIEHVERKMAEGDSVSATVDKASPAGVKMNAWATARPR
jgi:hypothetical protein